MRFFRRSDLDEFSINFGPSRPIHSPVHSEAGVAARVQTVVYVRNGRSLTFGVVWCFLWGAVALVLRAASATTRRQLLWGAIGIAVAAIAAAVVSRRRLPSRDSVRAMLDSRNDCGGLLMAGADADLG